jgi:hypothetical protein
MHCQMSLESGINNCQQYLLPPQNFANSTIEKSLIHRFVGTYKKKGACNAK